MNTRVCDSGQLMPVDEAIEQLLAQAPPAPPTEVIPLGQAAGRVIAEELFHLSTCRAGTTAPWTATPCAPPMCRSRAATWCWPGGLLPGTAAMSFYRPGRQYGFSPVRRCRPAPTAWCPRSVAASTASVSGARRCAWANTCASAVKKMQRGQPPCCVSASACAPQEVGLLASAGIPWVKVYRPSRVCLLSSGDELREPGSRWRRGRSTTATVACCAVGWSAWDAK